MTSFQQSILMGNENINAYQNPLWMPNKPEDSQINNNQNLERLNFLNKQLDEELNKYQPLLNNRVNQGYNTNFSYSSK